MTEFQRISRRTILKSSLAVSLLTVLPGGFVKAGEPIEHPVMGGIAGVKPGKCPNCGMGIHVWGRTRHSFTLGDAQYTTCSVRCLSDMARRADLPAKNVQVALYMHPETMIPAKKAVYVIGSDALGTMTMRSKPAFADQAAADAFIKEHGGKKTNFTEAEAAARDELDASYKKIEQKRLKKGKIQEPNKDSRCQVCGMYPARFTKHNCQLQTADGSFHHFCSTRCLLNFLAESDKYLKKREKIKNIWVKIYPNGGWEYAGGLYYLTDSSILGPMGAEALPFRFRRDAEKTAAEKGGRIYRFQELINLEQQ